MRGEGGEGECRGEQRGLDLDGGYHNRLKCVFPPISAPSVSHWSSGGASSERPGQMTSLPYGI